MSGWRTFWLMPKIYDVEKTHLAKARKLTYFMLNYILYLVCAYYNAYLILFNKISFLDNGRGVPLTAGFNYNTQRKQ